MSAVNRTDILATNATIFTAEIKPQQIPPVDSPGRFKQTKTRTMSLHSLGKSPYT